MENESGKRAAGECFLSRVFYNSTETRENVFCLLENDAKKKKGMGNLLIISTTKTVMFLDSRHHYLSLQFGLILFLFDSIEL